LPIIENTSNPMKPTTIYLPEETEETLQELANKTGKSMAEIIEELVTNHFTPISKKLPKSIGMGASGRTDLSSKAEELLWTEK
jgi:hypothetical protein